MLMQSLGSIRLPAVGRESKVPSRGIPPRLGWSVILLAAILTLALDGAAARAGDNGYDGVWEGSYVRRDEPGKEIASTLTIKDIDPKTKLTFAGDWDGSEIAGGIVTFGGLQWHQLKDGNYCKCGASLHGAGIRVTFSVYAVTDDGQPDTTKVLWRGEGDFQRQPAGNVATLLAHAPNLHGQWNGYYVRENEDKRYDSQLHLEDWNRESKTFRGDWDGFEILDGKISTTIGDHRHLWLTWRHEKDNKRYTCTAEYNEEDNTLKATYTTKVIGPDGNVTSSFMGGGVFKR